MAHSSKRFAKLLERAKQRPQYWVSKITLEFANTLSDMLKGKDISRKELAGIVETSPAYITKVLRGDANYTVETMVKLAMAVDARVEIHLLLKEQLEWKSAEIAFAGRGFQPIAINNRVAASNQGQWQTLNAAA
ncbi:MAG TPA: XRE family transcriptional regulator [Gammaproteobacteria bacterium]|nr:XRE family transcriptional regulator [Gammaproteobacteria bacterium]